MNISLRLKPPHSGFYRLNNSAIGDTWTMVDIATLSVYESANLLASIREGVVESQTPYGDIEDAMLMDGNTADMLRECIAIEATNTCSLADMGIGTPRLLGPVDNTTILSTSFLAEIEDIMLPEVMDRARTFVNWELSLNDDFFGVVQRSFYSNDNVRYWPVSNLAYGNTYYLRAQIVMGVMLSRWSQPITIRIASEGINPPEILSPIAFDDDVDIYEVVELSAYAAIGMVEEHSYSVYQISLIEDFSTILWESGLDEINLTSLDLSGIVERNTAYYIRAKYGSTTHESEYSRTVSFATNAGAVYGSVILAGADGRYPKAIAVSDAKISYTISRIEYSGVWKSIITMLDEDLVPIADKLIESSNDLYLEDIVIDSNYIYVSGFERQSNGRYNAVVMRYDHALTSSIAKVFTHSGNSLFFGMELYEDTLYLVGRQDSDQYVAKVNTSLVLLSSIGLDGSYECDLYDLASHGGFLYCVGFERKTWTQRSAYIVKLDTDLNIQAQKRFIVPNGGQFHSIHINSSGDIMIGGKAWNDGFYVAMNTSLAVSRQYKVAGSSTDSVTSVLYDIPTASWIIGLEQSSSPIGHSNGSVIVLDKNYNVIRQLYVNDNAGESIASIYSHDGSIYIVGNNNSIYGVSAMHYMALSSKINATSVIGQESITIGDPELPVFNSSYSYGDSLLIISTQVISTSDYAHTIADIPMVFTAGRFS